MIKRMVQTVAIAALAAAALDAHADFRTVVRAHEVALSQLRLPAAVNGSLSFRSCESCDPQTLSVTGATRYLINDQPVGMREFRRQTLQIGDRESNIVIVKQDMESGDITSVSVRLANGNE